jgi:lipoprotein-releasing system permease protein
MRTELFISLRYLLTRRKEKFISLISVISVLGVAIGVAALIIVIGVMAGFDQDLRDKIVGNYAHITVSSYKGLTNSEYADIAAKLKKEPHVRSFSPYVQGQVLLKEGRRLFAVGLKGIVPQKEAGVTRVKEYLVKGSLNNLGQDGIILGRELALYLNVGVGSRITVYSGLGKQQLFQVRGIFASGMYDYDMNLVFMGLSSAQALLGAGERMSAVAIKLDNLRLADKVRARLNSVLGPAYDLKTWSEANANFFAALELEKLTMFIILVLIVLVAAFNIASTLIVMVVEKAKDIGILKALGMDAKAIRKIFTCQGLIIGSSGIALGVFIGVTLCALLEKYQFIQLPRDIYYLDRLPVAVQWWPDVFLIILSALAITLVSTVYPAARAASLEPVEALRYE